MKIPGPPSICLALLAGLALGGCQKEVPQSQMPHFATFCVPRARWNDFLMAMRRFGNDHGLELHGGIERFPGQRPTFNAYLARGYSYYFGDDLDLWIVGSPYKEGEMSFSGMARNPWSANDLDLARSLLRSFAPLRCPMARPGG